MIGLKLDNIEKERLSALSQYQILDTKAEQEFDAIAKLASYICNTPIAVIALIDSHRRWIKSKIGTDFSVSPREKSLCQFTIQSDSLLEISDIQNDPFFGQIDLGSDSELRFYAGVPLINPEGYRLGTMYVADYFVRGLSDEQREALQILSREVMSHLEGAKKNRELTKVIESHEQMFSLFNNSPELHAILDDTGHILMVNNSVERLMGYSPQEILGRNIWEFCPPGDRDKVMPSVEAGLMRGETYFEVETRIITRSGQLKWFAWCDTRQDGRWLINGRDITEKKRQDEEIRLLSLVASSVDNGVIISSGNKVLWANNAFEQITGYSKEEVLGKQIGDVLKGEDTDGTVLEQARKYLRNKQSFEIELLIYKKDGSPVWLSIFSSLILNEEGEVDKEIEILIDITKRKQIEEELKVLSIAASKTSSGLIIRNINNEIEWANEAFEHITGYTLDEIKGKPVSNAMIGKYTDISVLQYAKDAAKEQRAYEIEICLSKKDGSPVWLYICNNPIFNTQGQMERQIAIAVDISARKSAEQQVELLSLVASKTVNGVAITDKAGYITWVNDAYEQLTGYSIEELRGRKAGDVLSGDGTNLQELDRARQLAQQHKSFNLEILNFRKDGEPVWFSISNTPVFDKNGELIQQVEIVNDITERKYAEFELVMAKEEALQLSKAKEMFLSVMSHEIRTPLNAVLGLSRILNEENTSPAQAESLSLLQFSAENLMALINDILDLTKIETGNLELEAIDISIKELITKTMSSIQFKAVEKGVSFKSEIDARVPDKIKGDETRIYQILMNLLGNSVKFTEQGEVRLKLELIDETNDSVSLRFEVADTGIGIPQDKLGQIFEVYKQAGADTSRKYGGTGLGLSITKKLIELHDSEIIVESEVGKGTMFSFVISFKKAETGANTGENAVERRLIGRVLVADDNQINCFLAKKVLSKWGLEVDFAENGQIALEKVQGNSYNLVLMDIQMPVMDGFESVEAIRAIEAGRFKDLPVIALTASALPEEIEGFTDAGMNGYVLKPFVPAELYAKISSYFRIEAT